MPYEEEGLGIRNIHDISKAFAIKLWWQFRERKSLWATFLMSKYCRSHHPTDVLILSKAFPVRRRVLKIRDIADG